MATNSVTIAVTGVGASETAEAFTKLPGLTEVSGGTRIGPGNITIPSLTVGLIYEIWVQAKSAGGLYGVASPSLFVLVVSGADIPTTRCGAWMAAIRDLFVSSANFLAWIQTVDAGETTAGHVILGFDPRTVPKAEETKGPNAFIFVDSYISENELSAKTYRDTFDIVAEVVWFTDPNKSAQLIVEIDFLCKIIDEFKVKGTLLSSTERGEVFAVTSNDLVAQNLNKRNERRAEIRFSVRLGTTG